MEQNKWQKKKKKERSRKNHTPLGQLLHTESLHEPIEYLTAYIIGTPYPVIHLS